MTVVDAIRALISHGIIEYVTLISKKHTLYSDIFILKVNNTEEVYHVEYNKTSDTWEIIKE